MDETEWRIVSRRRGGPKTDRKCKAVNRSEFALSSSKYTGQAAACISDEAVDPEKRARAELVAQVIEQLTEEIQISALWEEIKCNLKNAVYAELASLRSAENSTTSFNPELKEAAAFPLEGASEDDPWGRVCGRVSFSLVCLGLGSPTDCSDVLSCRYQLALGVLLRKLLRIPRGSVQVQDPLMNEVDGLVLSALSLCPPAEGEIIQEGRSGELSEAPPEVEVTVYLAPHCDADLYGELLGLELKLQPFCLRCFSCVPSSSSSHNHAAAKHVFSLLRNASRHSRQKTHGFVLIANLLSSYELRRSFFGELEFSEYRKINIEPQTWSLPTGEEEHRDCPEAAAQENALGNFHGSLSANQQKQKEEGVHSLALCCSSELAIGRKKQTESPQCQQVANTRHVARCPYTPSTPEESSVVATEEYVFGISAGIQ
ncbi:hypothetical protein Emag_002698 [Eimeria magna]